MGWWQTLWTFDKAIEKMNNKCFQVMALILVLTLLPPLYAVGASGGPAEPSPAEIRNSLNKLPAKSTAETSAAAVQKQAAPSGPQTPAGNASKAPAAVQAESVNEAATAANQAAASAIEAAGTQKPPPPAPANGYVQAVLGAVKGLLDGLVEEGALTRDKADAILEKTRAQVMASPEAKRPPPPANPNVVGVPYVPEFVKDEIRDQVRNGLRKDVLKDVLTQAKEERWGMPGVVPRWVERLHWYGDLRLREESDFFAKDNARNYYLDFQKINQAGGVGKVSIPFLNTTQERDRLRIRARLGMDANVTDSLKAGVRITTGNTLDPVSTNQTLGNYGDRYQVVWDQAYLRYQRLTVGGFPWLTLWGGRLPNPWLHTDLVWDSDLNFEGLAGTLSYNFTDKSGQAGDRKRDVFFTLGAFPLQEIELSSRDKYLFGTQLGTDWQMRGDSIFHAGVAYYDYVNITGKLNALDSNLLDFTAPQFVQKGNTLYDIRNDTDPNTNLYALAAEYRLLNFTASVDFALFAPTHVIITGDYVNNIGYNEQKVFERTGAHVGARNQGYQLEIAVGYPHIDRHGDWRITGAFKHLERDAVLDAFTDSDFHLGGTDAEGWILEGDYGLMEDTWLTLRWLSSDSIDGPPLGIDILQVDLNAKF